MERAERFILLGVCFIAGAVSASAFVPALWVFFGLYKAPPPWGRFVRVWQLAEGPVRVPAVRPVRTASGAGRWPVDAPPGVDSRWRTWRDDAAAA